MKPISILTLLFLSIPLYSQTFQMEYKNSMSEIKFDIIYTGPKGEITLPKLAQITAITEEAYISRANKTISIGISAADTNLDPTINTEKEYSVKFSYSLISHNSSGLGTISDSWYPTLKNTIANYIVNNTETLNTMLVFPYETHTDNSFSFSTDQSNILMIIGKHSLSKYSSDINTTVYSSSTLETTINLIPQIYTHLTQYLGDLGIKEIILIQNSLVTLDSFVKNDKLYMTLPNRGNVNQIRQIMINAWASKIQLSPYLFDMFKDLILRLSILNTTKEETPSINITIETDPSKITLVPPNSYYTTLLTTGFENNAISATRIPEMFNNYALLHMAWYNIGVESLLTGIQEFFNRPPDNVEDDSQNISTTTEKVDWSIITQNKIKEPLFSLYTKEVLIEKGIVPYLKSSGNTLFRNSLNIPDLIITLSSEKDEAPIDIKWDGARTITIETKEEGYYTLDSERQVPQQSFIDSYYTFNNSMQTQRAQIINMAEKQTAPGEKHFRKHLDIVELVADSNNKFNIPEGSVVYIVISHVLSNITGSLADAIKETFFVIQKDGTIKHLATRLRV